MLLGKRVRKGTGQRVSDEMRNRDGGFGSARNRDIDVRPKNWLVPVALLTLREKSSHGYELMDRIAGFGFEQINPGTLYRALRKMEKEGLCESEWETSLNGGGSGAACRTYSVTDAGEVYLEDWAEGCKKYQRVLDSFYLGYGAGSR
jgi:PadR family transcriptional regulator, regulatory protein PadR